MRFSVEGVLNVLKAMLAAMPTTMLLSVSVLIISLAIATVMAFCEFFHVKYVQGFIKVYTSFCSRNAVSRTIVFLLFWSSEYYPIADLYYRIHFCDCYDEFE